MIRASDGSADMKEEKMDAGFIVGMGSISLVLAGFESAAQVGGLLAALRVELPGLLYLILKYGTSLATQIQCHRTHQASRFY